MHTSVDGPICSLPYRLTAVIPNGSVSGGWDPRAPGDHLFTIADPNNLMLRQSKRGANLDVYVVICVSSFAANVCYKTTVL